MEQVAHQSTLQKAANFYIEKGDDFWRVLDYHTKYGVVYMDGKCFGMMRPCLELAPFNFCFPQDADSWYIEYVYGDLPTIARVLAGANPYIKRFGFTRNNQQGDVRFYDINSFIRKTNGTI
jgi:hypothetical protein